MKVSLASAAAASIVSASVVGAYALRIASAAGPNRFRVCSVKLATVGCTGARVTLDRISSAFQPASNGTALFSPAAYISAAVFGRTYPSMIGENHWPLSAG